MKVLVIGSGEKAVKIVNQLVMAGHAVGHTTDEKNADRFLEGDVILFVDCERLEETDLVAERLKRSMLSATVKTYVFVLWDAICGFDTAAPYGLGAIDILIEEFSTGMFEQAYQYAKHNGL
jgi:hypothetical protein